MENSKIPPQNINEEQTVLGTLMNFKNAFSEVSSILSPECFYNENNKTIYEAIVELYNNGQQVNIISVSNFLRKNNSNIKASEISEISDRYIIGSPYETALHLNELAIRRKLIEASNYMLKNSYVEVEDVQDIISKTSDMLSSMLRNNSSNVKTMLDIIQQMNKAVYLNYDEAKIQTGLPTGFEYYDNRSGGLQASDLIIIAAKSGLGKTSLAMAISKSVAQTGNGVAIYSLEMSAVQLCARFTAMQTGISSKKIMYSKLNIHEFNTYQTGIAKIEQLPIYIDETSISSIESILTSIRYMAMKYGVKLVIIDYIQLIETKALKGMKEQQTAYIVRKLKNIAKELNITVIALSQLSRDNNNEYPKLSLLRDSGQIEEAADIVMFIYRPEYYGKSYLEPFENKSPKGTALIEVAKGRNIGTFRFMTKFDAETTCFSDAHIDAIPNVEYVPVAASIRKSEIEAPF